MKLINDLYFPDSDTHMAEEYLKGRTQLDTLKLGLTFCSKTRVAINGGAHVGLWSIACAELFDEIHAFEPCADTYSCLVRNTNKYPNIKPYPVGLSDRAGKAGMGQDTRWPGNTGGNYLIRGEGECTTITVDSLDLSDVSVVLFDLEGHELQAFQGAVETIKRCSPVIVCEEKSRLMQRQGNEPNSVREFLGSLGYVRAAQNRRDFVYVKELV